MGASEVPIVCTLSPNTMVTRLAELEGLFAEGLRGVEREPLCLRLRFDAGRESVIRDLFAREEQCCAFLGFAYERIGSILVVEVSAPEGAGPTLDGMQALAARNASPQVVARRWTP